jgi:hypothetical protein
LDRLEAAADDWQHEAEDEPNFAQHYVPEAMRDGQSARDYLAQVAEETRRAVIAEAGVDLSQPAAGRDPVEQALEMVASSITTWEEDAPEVQEYLQQSGVDLGPVIATGDPATIAKVVYTAQMQVSLGQSNREIKRAAQTMRGGNSSPESTSAWDAIKAAGDGSPPRVRW